MPIKTKDVMGPKTHRRRLLGLLSCTAIGTLGLAAPAAAEQYELGGGWELRTLIDLSVGAAMRVSDADKSLIARGNGGSADGTTTDDGNLNYGKGDLYSLLGKAVGEVQVSKDGLGVFIRGKAWYDAVTERNDVAFGHAPNGYRAERLNDSDFFNLSKFKGAEFLDAYVFGDFDMAGGRSLSVKFGQHVVNWGESLFISGINQYAIVDGSAARRPGSQVKELLLPVPQVSLNLGLGGGFSVEAFYQLKWKPSVFEGCGTFWSPSDTFNCSDLAVNQAPNPTGDRQGFYGAPALGGLNARLGNAGDMEPKDSGQFGAALRYFASDIGTDFGVYYAQYHARNPIYSLVKSPTTISGSIYGRPISPAQFFQDWSAENIKVAGVSASTVIGGWSVGGEISHSMDVPVQINTSDLAGGLVSGAGPLAGLRNVPAGTVIHGFDRKDKTQIQVSTIKTFPNVLGADSLGLLGEVAFQHWQDIGDPETGTRYGRSPAFGRAGSATTACGTSATQYCSTEGYATSNSWGLRARAALTYSDVFAGLNLTPRVSLAWDVDGYSPDGTFIEDRVNVGFGIRADLLQRYYADLTYSVYNRAAKYDAQRDHDFVALVIGMTF